MTASSVDVAFEISEVVPSVVLVKFTLPIKRNPLSLSTLTHLGASLPPWLARDDIKAIVVTGSADIFASGADIRELAELNRRDAEHFAELGQNLFQSIANASQRFIAAINGYCFGGALDLALACDFRLASHNATFAHPGARLGIITGWGGTQRLPRLIGKARALELLTTAKTIEAQTALRFGLIDRIADPVLETAIHLAISSP